VQWRSPAVPGPSPTREHELVSWAVSDEATAQLVIGKFRPHQHLAQGMQSERGVHRMNRLSATMRQFDSNIGAPLHGANEQAQSPLPSPRD
jgi:hypothetical protein